MDTVNSIKKLIKNLNNKRLINHQNTASNQGFLGVHAPGNNEQHVNHGTFKIFHISFGFNEFLLSQILHEPHYVTLGIFGILLVWCGPSRCEFLDFCEFWFHDSAVDVAFTL